MSKEKRIHKRVGIDVSARIFNPSGEIVLGEGKIMDISTGGAKLATMSALKAGEKVHLEFLVHKMGQDREKDKLVLTCEVETVWKTGEKDEIKIYGVRFMNLSTITKDLISRFIELLHEGEQQTQ